jgi:HSP20 family protein
MTQLHTDLDRLMENRVRGVEDPSAASVADWVPPVDIKEEDTRFVIQADIPGVRSEDVEITMEAGLLTLKGSRLTESAEAGRGYRRSERASGTFYRRFTLPDTADSEGIKARIDHGVLEVDIPKLPKVQPRRIDIQVS